MILTNEIIEEAWRLESRGKHSQDNQAKFEYYLEDNIVDLFSELVRHTYRPAPLRPKYIKYPKPRVAQVPSLKDKIVQHILCDNYAYDALTKPLIKETCACLKGKGSDYACDLTIESFHKYYKKYHSAPYILKLDIHSYFASIPHDRVKALINRYILDEDVKIEMLKFVDLTDIGLPLGLQQSQLLANLYLSEIDHLLKEKHGCEFYVRYMDDFYIFSDSYEELLYLFKEIKSYLLTIGLELNPKSAITHNHLEFLGFMFKLTDTGKVIVRLSNSKKLTKRHALRIIVKDIYERRKTLEQGAQSYFGWRVHALKGNTRNVVLQMDKVFDNELRKYGYKLFIDKKGKVTIICLSQLQN